MDYKVSPDIYTPNFRFSENGQYVEGTHTIGRKFNGHSVS